MPIYHNFVTIPTLHPRNSTPKLQLSNSSCYKSSSSPNTPPNPFEETPKNTHTPLPNFSYNMPTQSPNTPQTLLVTKLLPPNTLHQEFQHCRIFFLQILAQFTPPRVPTLQNLLVTNPHPIHSTKRSNTAEFSCYKASPIHSTKSSNTAESSCYKSSPNSLHQKVPTLQNLLVTNHHPIHSKHSCPR